MKKILLFLFLTVCAAGFAGDLTGGITESSYSDCLEMVDLTPAQRNAIIRIKREERAVLEPLALDLASKERGLELLNSMQCKTFDFKCKEMLKENIEQREFEKREALYKIQQKKDYYNIRYRNILTRAQDIKVQELLKENAHKEKVLKERTERAEKQERIDKFKIWEKFKSRGKDD